MIGKSGARQGRVVEFDADFWVFHLPHLRSRLLRLGFSHADVDDLVQHTFVVAQRKRARLPRGRGRQRAWLDGIAWRLAMNLRRQTRCRRRWLGDESLEAMACGEFDIDDFLDTQRLVEAASSQWPAEDREMLFEYFVDGDSLAEIAARHGLARSTTWSRLQRLRRDAVEKAGYGVKRNE